jgi:hypothetical protein
MPSRISISLHATGRPVAVTDGYTILRDVLEVSLVVRVLNLMKKPVIRSMFPCRPREASRMLLVVFGVLASASVAALAFGWFVPACLLAVLSTFFLEGAIDRRLARDCPHCGQRSMRVVGRGGIWYEYRQDLREERVFWGQCSCCGGSAIRRGAVFAQWTAYPEAEENAPPRA